jgi:signal transduction histidine kinase
MASSERPNPDTLDRISHPDRAAFSAISGVLDSDMVRGNVATPIETFSRAAAQPKAAPRTANALKEQNLISQSRLAGMNRTNQAVQISTDERRERVSEEFSELLEVLCNEEVEAPLIPASSSEGDLIELRRHEQRGEDAMKAPILLAESVELLQNKQIRKGKKIAEAQLAKKVEELARSNSELEQFAYVASHDLQEPLRMIANYTQLLAERYSGKLDVQADKYIRYASDGAIRMQALIQDLLAFSRAGGPGKGLRLTDCKEIVEQAIKNLQVAIEDSRAVVTYADLPVVMARSIQMEQVFQNLIGNAIKFCSAKPPVIRISAQKNGVEWVFSVVDNGINIAAENSEVIFAIFQRLHSRTEYAGNGIGLAICKKIVEQHGGRIWVEPQTAPGSTFKFTWPAIALEQSA